MSPMSSNITYHDIENSHCLLCHLILHIMILITQSKSTMSSNITSHDIYNSHNRH
jgi:hypothetical protein